MLFLTKEIQPGNITLNFLKKPFIKAVSAAAVINITYSAFNVLFVIIFCNFKAYDIQLFIIKKRIR